jgi:hypothetical protein
MEKKKGDEDAGDVDISRMGKLPRGVELALTMNSEAANVARGSSCKMQDVW